VRKNIQQLFEEYVMESRYSRRVRPETIRGYQQAFASFMKVVPDVCFETLTPATITRFFRILEHRKRIVGRGIVKVGVKKSTIVTYWSKLFNFFEWLQIREHIKINPFRQMQYPRVEYADRRFLSRQDVERIISAIHSKSSSLFLLKRNLTIFYILLFCGLRREELLLLQIRDIDMERKMLTVRAETSKIPRTRHIPIHSQLWLHIKDYLRERKEYTSPFLIVSSKGDNRLSYEGLNNLVAVLKRQSGVSFHLHRFRHTFAVNFLKTSNNIAKLKQLMGHKDIRMTMVYLRCMPPEEMTADIENMSIDEFI
jgi:integrase/recombinase XerD